MGCSLLSRGLLKGSQLTQACPVVPNPGVQVPLSFRAFLGFRLTIKVCIILV